MLVRVKGIEPLSQAWEARILPLNYTRSLERFCISANSSQLKVEIWHKSFIFQELEVVPIVLDFPKKALALLDTRATSALGTAGIA